MLLLILCPLRFKSSIVRVGAAYNTARAFSDVSTAAAVEVQRRTMRFSRASSRDAGEAVRFFSTMPWLVALARPSNAGSTQARNWLSASCGSLVGNTISLPQSTEPSLDTDATGTAAWAIRRSNEVETRSMRARHSGRSVTCTCTGQDTTSRAAASNSRRRTSRAP